MGCKTSMCNVYLSQLHSREDTRIIPGRYYGSKTWEMLPMLREGTRSDYERFVCRQKMLREQSDGSSEPCNRGSSQICWRLKKKLENRRPIQTNEK